MMRTVRVINSSKNAVIAERVEMATSFLSRLRGLLGRHSLGSGQGMLLRPTDSIHTFFMAFPIDVIFLDRANIVIHLIPDMGRNRVSPLVRHGRTVIELPPGTIARSETTIGDHIQVE
jgi:uncharacterized protein